MARPVIASLPKEKVRLRRSGVAPSSEIAEIRGMFREMSRQYLAHQPSPFYTLLKRGMDLLVSSLFVLLVLSWIFPLVAILIKLTSRGPVLFVQKRTGLYGCTFDCFKFRTMRVNAEAHTQQCITNDPRITPLGRFLRASHIDELPQLFNVFLGDMSLIGPRPHMLYHTQYYAGKIPFYNLRHEAAPGMTGMAQIKGYIGEITDERELRKRIQWDVYYLKNRGVALDLHILGQTFREAVHKVFPKLKKDENFGSRGG